MTPPIIIKPPRFSRYAKQTLPWQRGYNWARQEGPRPQLPCTEAMEAWGYDIGSEEAAEFGRGVDHAQFEQGVRSA